MVDNHNYLIQKAYSGLQKRGLSDKQVYIQRLDYELDIIKSGNLADFFLNTAYICIKMKSKGIPVNLGRGSASGSLVCYCLKITEIDPLKHNLLFERFLNPTRINSIASADIDTDISRNKRQEVLKMVKNDFGETKTFQIINKLQWTNKTAIKDLGKIIGLPFTLTNRITKLISDDAEPESIPQVLDFLNQYPFIKQNYKKLNGLIKTYGIHAGGLITLDKPVEYYDSILKINGVLCLDNDGKTCDNLGFLKNDLLGLNTLSIIDDCLSLLPKVSLPKEYNDKSVYDTINKSTLGIFQFEGAGVSDVCKRIKPSNFEELCLVCALARPGAMDSGDTDHYIARREGRENITYDHPLLEPILSENLGTIVYQEDAMHIVTDFAGMSAVDADTIRKGIGKKIQSVFDEYHPKFIKSCENRGIDEEIAENVWKKMEASASYSFNKSHCVSYTALSYICAFLKTYYPIEFFLAMLNNTEDEDKKMKIYSEIREMSNELVNPDINISKDITIKGYNDKIYLGLNLIKEVGAASIKKIVESQPYSSFKDFRERCKVNKRVIKALIEAGAFDRFTEERDLLYSEIDEKEHYWDEKEKLFREFSRIKINPKGNVLDLFNVDDLNIQVPISTIAQIEQNKQYNDFYIKVLSSDLQVKDDYAYASVTDGFNTISILVAKEFIDTYIDDFNEVGTPLLLHVHGKTSKYTLLSLINLYDTHKHQKQINLYTHQSINILKELQDTNPNCNIGIIKNVRYFYSKKQRRCCWYDIYISDSVILEDRVCCDNIPNFEEGSYIFFLMTDNKTFPNIIKVV